MPDLIARSTSRDARVAMLDLVWAERFVNVAHTDRESYRIRRNASRFFSISRHLAAAVGRYPLIQWTDIAEHYTVNDPRTFLSSGHDRLQEIHLYRVQSAIERGARRIVLHWGSGHPEAKAQEDILAISDGIAKSMANLTRKRQPGELDKLDRFLSPNDEVIGHATGSFSAWTKLAGYLCTGRESMLGAIVDPLNRAAFNAETSAWIAKATTGQIDPLCPERGELAHRISKRCTDFHLIHRGAVKRHASGALSCPAPSMRSISNLCAMNRSITGRS